MSVLRNDLRSAFEHKKLVDVTFLVGYDVENVEKIGANSVILRLRSPVFNTQFSKPWCNINSQKEGDNDCSVIVEIPDANPASFRSFLNYLYTDELEVPNLKDVIGVYYLGAKYDVPHLVDACLKLLEQSLEEHNVLPVLEEASKDLYKNFEQLQAAIYKTFSQFSKQLIISEEFTSTSLNVLRAIVKLDVLGMSESQLFARIYKWAIAECKRQSFERTNQNIRRVLGSDVLYNIRFLSLLASKKDTYGLGRIIWGPNGILTDEEQLSLFRRQTLGCGAPVLSFNTSARNMRKYCSVQRINAAIPMKEWSSVEMNKERNHCSFSINARAELIGFGFFGSCSLPNAKYDITFEIKEQQWCIAEVTTLTSKRVCGEPGSLMTVFLEKPMVIPMKTWYLISYSIKGPTTFAGDGNVKASVIVKHFLPNNQIFMVQFKNEPEQNSVNQLPIFYFRTWTES